MARDLLTDIRVALVEWRCDLDRYAEDVLNDQVADLAQWAGTYDQEVLEERVAEYVHGEVGASDEEDAAMEISGYVGLDSYDLDDLHRMERFFADAEADRWGIAGVEPAPEEAASVLERLAKAVDAVDYVAAPAIMDAVAASVGPEGGFDFAAYSQRVG